MSKKSIIILISCVAAIAAAVTAVIVFHKEILDFIDAVKAKLQKPTPEPEEDTGPDFTPEEREAFADI